MNFSLIIHILYDIYGKNDVNPNNIRPSLFLLCTIL
jgi:hypothetical protein